MDLQTIDFSTASIKTPWFSLEGLTTKARVVDIIDGDTLIAVLPIHGTMYKFSVRIFGIDTCELKSKADECQVKAVAAWKAVVKLITRSDDIDDRVALRRHLDTNISLVTIECCSFDKYGRLLAHIICDNCSVSDMLLDEKLAYPYFGAAKLSEHDQLRMLR